MFKVIQATFVSAFLMVEACLVLTIPERGTFEFFGASLPAEVAFLRLVAYACGVLTLVPVLRSHDVAPRPSTQQ
jgi:hypothetical protein